MHSIISFKNRPLSNVLKFVYFNVLFVIEQTWLQRDESVMQGYFQILITASFVLNFQAFC